MISRLKGIETYRYLLEAWSVLALDMISRLKGIETLFALSLA